MLICGEIHYFRVPRDLWRDRLLKLKRSGANCVSTYIPWNWHNPREDVFDFEDLYYDWSIPRYYSRKLSEFLDLAMELGLKTIARPGPYICSEWDSGGHPNWIYLKTSKLRSLDPNYMCYVSRWYDAVLPILAKYTERKALAILQVENEYFWGNEPYIERLYEEALKHIKDIPIVTNENPYLSRVPNTIDDYPAPWDIRSYDEKIKKYMETQERLLKMFMEIEGGWFSSIKHGNTPTNRLEFPAEWTEILIKTAIGLGLNNLNIYMFHGGSNPGYYTGKYISTSYDFSAAIREWGELSKRYYNIKRTYLFLNSFNEEVEKTKPVRGVFKQTSTCSEIFERVGEGLSIIVLRNIGDIPCYQRVLHDDRVLPRESSILVKPRYAKLLVFNYKLGDTPFKLEYTSVEILLKTEFNKTHVLVLYGDPGEETETAITFMEKLSNIVNSGSARISEVQGSIVIKLAHSDLDSIVILESTSGSRLILVYTSRERAERTWVIDNGVYSFIVISNIYYIGSSSQLGNSLEIETELDENSCGYTTLVSPIPLDEVLVNNSNRYSLEKVADNIYRLYIPSELCRKRVESEYIVNELVAGQDPVDHRFIEAEPSTPLEKIGFYDNGLYIYKIKFSLSRDMLSSLLNGIIALSNINDYAVLSLNGTYLTSGYHYVEVNAMKYLKEGDNELTILLESTGHPNDGLIYVPNGITGDLYLEKTTDIPLVRWRKVEFKLPYGPGFDMSSFLERPDLVKGVLSKWRELSSTEVYDIDTPGLYIKEITIDEIKGYYLIEPGESFYYNHYYRVLLFVNGEYLGPFKGPIDISKHLRQGLNELAIFVEWGVVSPRLITYRYKLKGDWWVQKDTYGIINEWYKSTPEVDFDYSTRLPIVIRNNGGKIFWFKANLFIKEEPDPSRPRYIQVNSSGLRLLVFINGNLVGRIYDESPVKSLYIPEPAIRRGLNEITLLAIITSNLATLESIKISEYYVNEKARIKFYSSYK